MLIDRGAIRHCGAFRTAAVVIAALVAVAAAPAVALARAEFTGWGNAECSVHLGLCLSLRLEAGGVRGAIELPGVTVAAVTLKAPDAVRWGIPVARFVAGITSARTDRPGYGSGLF